ncbi:Altered inheritance of mitochondria protein 6 [Neofusicoccum ribis]|uniref:Altered inheritance of mitochondria protein 6 n=1 Tax=Neofusicoccum ribis TaxID=45134 RepID=A0ABR3T4C0_9PEZI
MQGIRTNLLQPVSIYMRRLSSRESSSCSLGDDHYVANARQGKRRRITRPIVSLLAISTFGVILWLLIAYLKIKSIFSGSHQSNAYSEISSLWKQPSDAVPLILYHSSHGANLDVNPLPCHSHNDYWRKVPLFDALSYGCTSVEADIWLPLQSEDRIQDNILIKNIELRVGHTRDSLDPDRTLDSLYLAPLFRMLYEQTSPDDEPTAGVFGSSPSTTLVLLIDFKPSEDPAAVWRALQIHLMTFRSQKWLTYWDREESVRVTGPLTVVATGDVPFEEIAASPHGDVFYDAPLDKLATDGRFNESNSHYASASLKDVVGGISLGQSLSSDQMDKLESAVGVARERGLVVRAWGIPSWPVATRNKIWEQLLEAGVGVLNVDSFETATKKDWRLCKIAGIEMCN